MIESIETKDSYRPLFYHLTASRKQQMKSNVDK